MQPAEAINRTWLGGAFSAAERGPTAAEQERGRGGYGGAEGLERMVEENAVVVFGRLGCCMGHVVKLLLRGLGVNPTVYEVEEKDEAALSEDLAAIDGEDKDGAPPPLPAVFVGGRLLGGMDRVMAAHISGELVPILKGAGALWL